MTAVGDGVEAGNANWSFEGIGEHFDDHVTKSVPLYHEGHELIARSADHFLLNGSLCYELGCSTGELQRLLATRNREKSVRFVGIDIEPSMVEEARRKCTDLPAVEIVEADIADFEFEPADVVIAYYTVQFVRPRVRQLVFDHVFEALNWGGAFYCFEKVRGPDARFQDIVTSVYTDYKLDQGYTPDEIVAKTRSLKGVLEPFSTAGNLGLFERAGFSDVMTIFKYACFEGFLAIK